jgi:glycine oxidase
LAKTTDVIIIGAGAIGCCIAYQLAKSKVKVVVIEKTQPGCEASSAAAGMLSPRYDPNAGYRPYFDLSIASHQLYSTLSEELKDFTGVDIELLHYGTLDVFLNEDDEKEGHYLHPFQKEVGLATELLTPEEVLKREPALSRMVRGALFFSKDCHVNNPRLVEALARGALQLGAEFMVGNPVTAILKENSRVTGVQVYQERILGSTLVIATGCWSNQMGSLLNYPLPVEPAKGQMVATTVFPPLLHHVVSSRKVYLVPRLGGDLLIGATVEFVGYDKQVTLEGVETLIHAALEMVPSLAGKPLSRTWAGLRPYSRDSLPILGPIPGMENVIVATGHFRQGILLTPITGKLIRELIVDGKTSLSLEPFSPKRFAL